MTIYIEYVLINNFIIDYLMLKATFSITGQKHSRKTLFFSSLVGAILALVFPLLSGVKPIYTAVKILSGFLISLLSASYKSVRSYFINTVVFFCYTFLTGGVIIGVFNIFNLDYTKEHFIAFMVLPVYLTLSFFSKVIKYIYRQREVRSKTYKVKLNLKDKSLLCTGFFDTGNALYDKDSPVIVCSKTFFFDFLKERLLSEKLKKINLSTVNGQSESLAVKLDSVEIYIKDEPNIFNNVTLAVASFGVGDGYDLILHPTLYKESEKESEDEKFIKEVKKVS